MKNVLRLPVFFSMLGLYRISVCWFIFLLQNPDIAMFAVKKIKQQFNWAKRTASTIATGQPKRAK